MKINLYYWNNCVGVVNDAILIKSLLNENDIILYRKSDIGIFIQNIQSDQLENNNKNIFIINEEWLTEYEDLKFLSQESTNIEETNQILFSDEIFIRNGIRYGTPCGGSPMNMTESSYFDEGITIKHFFENIKINDFILDKIKINEDRFLKNKVCGIHIRYGNNVETTNPLRYPNWISDDSLINSIKNRIEQFCDDDSHFFICTDTQKVNDMLLKELPNSFSFKKDYSAENEKIMLLNPRLNPISSFQDSFLDMYFLTRCSKLIYISNSVFTTIPQCYYNDNDKSLIF